MLKMFLERLKITSQLTMTHKLFKWQISRNKLRFLMTNIIVLCSCLIIYSSFPLVRVRLKLHLAIETYSKCSVMQLYLVIVEFYRHLMILESFSCTIIKGCLVLICRIMTDIRIKASLCSGNMQDLGLIVPTWWVSGPF